MKLVLPMKLFADLSFWKGFVAVLAGLVNWMFPTPLLRETVIVAMVAVAIDTMTGLMAAWQSGQISSRGFARVIIKGAGYFSVCFVASAATRYVPGLTDMHGFGVGAALGVILLTELISILENVHRMGLELPFGLTAILQQRLAQAQTAAKPNPETETRP